MNGATLSAMINILATLTENVDAKEVQVVSPDERGNYAALCVNGFGRGVFPPDVVAVAKGLGFDYQPYDASEPDEWWNFTQLKFSLL